MILPSFGIQAEVILQRILYFSPGVRRRVPSGLAWGLRMRQQDSDSLVPVPGAYSEGRQASKLTGTCGYSRTFSSISNFFIIVSITFINIIISWNSWLLLLRGLRGPEVGIRGGGRAMTVIRWRDEYMTSFQLVTFISNELITDPLTETLMEMCSVRGQSQVNQLLLVFPIKH